MNEFPYKLEYRKKSYSQDPIPYIIQGGDEDTAIRATPSEEILFRRIAELEAEVKRLRQELEACKES